MTPDQQRAAADLFEEVVDLSPAERELILRAREAKDPEVGNYVRVLLDISAQDWEPPIPPSPAAPALPAAGSMVGNYHIEEQIGEGGFGTVFRAVRQVGQTRSIVAIKVIRAPLQDAKARERFHLERQLLAELDHPGIARLIDGGVTRSGLPFVVIEYVSGKPITDYCDESRLTVVQRLHLFLKVCAAVEYAHRHQALHRDLKPDNIFVTPEGEVKLLDFGIAKLLSPQLGPAPPTLPAQRTFSLSHASPEQIDGTPLSFSTDVYSLGVVLYELITGHLPFPEPALWNVIEAQETRKRSPMQPSDMISMPPDPRSPITAESVGTARGTLPGQLRKALRGDLDAIVLTAMRPHPRERYSSVEALRFDVERFLEQLPIEAAPHRWTYKTRKWIRRNPATSIVLGFAACLLIYGANSTGMNQFHETESRLRLLQTQRMAQDILFPGLPKLYSSLETVEARRAVLDTEIAMLNRIERMPVPIRYGMRTSRLFAYRHSAIALWSIDRRAEAETSISAAIDGAREVVDQNPGDLEWEPFYRQCLELRRTYRLALGREQDAAEDARRLLELDAHHMKAKE